LDPTDTVLPDSPEETINPFEALGLSPGLVQAVADAGYTTPTPIQAQAIPALLAGRDVIGQARTGTGKTAAFVLPLLDGLDRNRPQVQGVVLVPTRELALQVAREVRTFGAPTRTRVATLYGGQPINTQIRQLERGTPVVVGTPGRVLDLLQRGILSFAGLDQVVLDEADEMLRMGFVEDIETILGFAPADRPRRTALFSATLSPAVRRVAEKHLKNPVDVRVEGQALSVPAITQQVIIVRGEDRLNTIDRLLEVDEMGSVLIFTSTRVGTAELADALEGRGHKVAAIHGDLGQAQREAVLERFRDGRIRILVATDVAARGLDVDDVTHVINYELPFDLDSYVHRIGRTGRAGRTGTAITLAEPRDRRLLGGIEHHAGQPLVARRPPTAADVVKGRAHALRERLRHAVTDLDFATTLAEIDTLIEEGQDPRELAAAAALLLLGDRGLIPDDRPPPPVPFSLPRGVRDRVRPGDIVGAICNDFNLPGSAVGAIDLGQNNAVVWIAARFADAIEDAGEIFLHGRAIPLKRADGIVRPNKPKHTAPRQRPPEFPPPRQLEERPGNRPVRLKNPPRRSWDR
jgi:ATP-dependent RNA helicase DeaD